MWKALSLPCDTLCSCDRTLGRDWTHTTGLTSHHPLLYSSELVWHSNTEQAAGCVFPQRSDTKPCKWKYIHSDPGDESSRNEEQEPRLQNISLHITIQPSCTLQNQNCLFFNTTVFSHFSLHLWKTDVFFKDTKRIHTFHHYSQN